MKKENVVKIIKSLLFAIVILYGLNKSITPVYATEIGSEQQMVIPIIANEQEKEEEIIEQKEEKKEKQEEEKTENLTIEKEPSIDLDKQEEKQEKQEEVPTKDSSKEDEDILPKTSSSLSEEKDNTSTTEENPVSDLGKKEVEEEKKESEVTTGESLDKNNNSDTIETKEKLNQDNNGDDASAPINNDDNKKEKTIMTKSTPTRSDEIHDIGSFITNVTIGSSTNDDEEYVVQVGKKYDVVMTFAESGKHQFPNSGTLTYVIPEGFDQTSIDEDGVFSMAVTTADGVVTVNNNHYHIKYDQEIGAAVLTVTWSTDENVHTLFAANNAKFFIRFRGKFDGTKEIINFNENVVTPLEFKNEQSSIEMTKKSSPSINTNLYNQSSKIDYIISITSTGTNTDVNLSDIIEGNGVKLSSSSFNVTSNETLNNYTLNINEATNKFTFHADTLVDGQTVTITYSALLDEKFAVKDDENKFIITANNRAKLVTEGHNDITRETNDRIEIKPSIEKSGTVDGENIIWTINVNANNKLIVNNMPVIDSFNSNSSEYMSYTGDGLTITVYNSKGQSVREETIPWSQLAEYTETGWTYIIPTDDVNDCYRYEIKYATTYKHSGMDKDLENDVHFGDNDSSSSVHVNGDDDIDLEKKAIEVNMNDRTVTWEINIHVPPIGLGDTNYVLTETYPSKYVIDRMVYEPVIPNSIEVIGLTGSEHCEKTFGATSATFTFFKDESNTPGLIGNGSQRDIKIILKTPIDEYWLSQTTSSNNSWFITHENRINMGGKPASDVVYIGLPTIEKTVSEALTVDINGVKYPYYKYNVLFGLINDNNIQLDDTFDTSIFGMYIPADTTDEYLVTKGGDTIYGTNTSANTRIDYIQTSTGLKFLIGSDKLAKKTDGSLYKYYSFFYYLMPKDSMALRNLMQNAVDNNGEYKFDNTIKYKNELEAHAQGIYKYSALNKRQVGEYNPKDGTVEFEIEVNPDALILNNGDSITLTDTYENMSIIYDSIEVTPSTGVEYDASGNSLTFTIPDNKKVTITYKARLIYDAAIVGAVEINYHNRAALVTGHGEFYKDVSGTEVITSTGIGTASVYSVYLIKYAAGNMANRLEGAIFELLDADKNNIYGKDSNGNPVKVTFRSGTNGLINVYGDEEENGWSLSADTRYYLREIQAPQGFQIANFDYSFMIASNNVPDYRPGQYIYYNGDTLTAKNYPGTDIFVEKEWEDGVGNHLSDNVTIRLQEKIGDDGQWQYSNVKAITLSASNNWKGSFNGLLLVITNEDGDDVNVTYRIIETLVNGNPITEDAFVITPQEGKPNTYTVLNKGKELSGEVEIFVIKELVGRNWNNDDSFEFTITAEEGTPLPNTTTITITKDDANYKESFGKISFTKEGTYTYTIKETNKGNTINGVVYDSEDKIVTITLVDDGNGNLIPSTEGETTFKATFTNEYTASGEEEIKVKKELSGRNWTDDDTFEFTITANSGTPLPSTTTITITQGDENHEKSFGKITFTEAGTYTYTIIETHKGRTINGVVYDSEDKTVTITLVDDGNGNLIPSTEGETTFKATFTNTYSASGEAEIKVEKKLEGRDWTTDDSFTFTLTALDGAPLPGNATEPITITITKDSENYIESFGKINYTEAGTYKYEIRETHEQTTANGITYDETVKEVTFTLVDDGKGNLVPAEGTSVLAIKTFTNTYSAEGSAEIYVEKILNGREWTTGDSFEFTLTGVDGAPLPEVTTITITKDSTDHKGTFGPINYTESGTYEYRIEEKHHGTTVDGIAYENVEYKPVTITLVDDGNGHLVPTEEGQTFGVTFTNTYDAKGEVTFSGKKVLKGRSLKEGEFTFVLLDETGTVIDRASNLADGTFSFKTITYELKDLNAGLEVTTKKYIIKEFIGRDTNIVYDQKEYEFEIKLSDNKNGVINVNLNPEDIEFNFTNEFYTHVSVSKVDFADGIEVEGAKLQVLDKDGKVVDEWTSTKEVHVVEKLNANEEYTLRELSAPEGYTLATDITFTIDEDGEVKTLGKVITDETGEQIILIEDEKTIIRVTKVDINTKEEVAGAKLQIVDSNGNIVEEWVSTEKAHVVEGLKTGETYTLKEIVAPEGYTLTSDSTFTIDETGKVTTTGNVTTDKEGNVVLLVEDEKTIVRITKVDINTKEEVVGAKLQIVDSKGNIVEEWVSTKETHIIEGLKTGETYTLKEIVAPNGYKVTTDSTFTIDETGKVTTTGHTTTDEEGNIVLLVEDEKTIVRITKVDVVTKEEVPGAKIQILDKEGKVVEEWVSTTKAHIVEGLKTGEKYTLKEIVAPNGYTVTTDSTFTIDENGKVTTTGHTTTDEEGNIVLLVEDTKTKVYISKVDKETGEDLEGATIQILDSKGNIVEEWTTTKEVHLVEGLKVNEEYTVREASAPEGYEIAKDITFTIDEKGNITTIGSTETDKDGNTLLLVQDYKIPTTPTKNPQTADYFEVYFMLFNLFVLGFVGGVSYLRKYNQA